VIDKAREAATTVRTVVEPVRTVDAFVLIHAVHGEGRFDVVGRWPLTGVTPAPRPKPGAGAVSADQNVFVTPTLNVRPSGSAVSAS
jgi:hypothetical protein